MSKLFPVSHPLSSTLLDRAWRSPHHCHQLAVRDPRSNIFKTVPVPNPEKAMSIALREASAGNDVFFAIAEYLTYESRKADNVAGAYAVWMDIDVGPDKFKEGTGYATVEEAEAEFIRFCNAISIPLPTHLILSGHGLHGYWILDTFVGRDPWQALAKKLKELARHQGFLADPSRTADISSLLRVPGTTNYKYCPALPVMQLRETDELIPRAVMADAIEAAHCRLVAPSRQQLRLVTSLAYQSSRAPCSSGTLNLLKVVLTHLDPDCHYDDWFRIGCAVCTETCGSEAGLALWDEWSSQGSKYRSFEQTRRKWFSMNPEHPRPVRIGSLKAMVEANGHEWQHILTMAAFEAETAV